ncbi:MAG: ankyrin repeat domain-containing protein [Acidobacteriota bacterium]|nr:ankyrin repeat domain-containing protein [Acidobacteriota bacterium]
MAEKILQKIDGAYAPSPRDIPRIIQLYKIKYAYYFMSGFILLIGSAALLMLRDLNQEGIYPMGLAMDDTIFGSFLFVLVIIGLYMRARAGTCVVCDHYRFPLLGINGYCTQCGAHLFRYQIFEKQEVTKAARDLNVGERLLEMASRGDTDAVHNLISKGAEIDFADKYGNTALMHAAMAGRVDTMNLLLMAAANPNSRNKFGLNALMLAVDKNQVDTVKLLLKHGLSPMEKANDGRNALDIARAQHNEDLIQLLSGFP